MPERVSLSWHPTNDPVARYTPLHDEVAAELDRFEARLSAHVEGRDLALYARLASATGLGHDVPTWHRPRMGHRARWAAMLLADAAVEVHRTAELVDRADFLAAVARGVVKAERRRWRVLAGNLSRSTGSPSLAEVLGVTPWTVESWRRMEPFDP